MTPEKWAQLFPDDIWPGSEAEADQWVAGEIASLRLLADTIVGTILDEPSLRPASQVQAAHDALVGLVLNEDLCGLVVSEMDRPWVLFAAETLCWVLQHQENGGTFAQNLKQIQDRLDQIPRILVVPDAKRRTH